MTHFTPAASFTHECKSAFDVDDVQADLRHRIKELHPSFRDSDHYLEDGIFAIVENNTAYIAISKNGSLFSLYLVRK